MQAVLNIDEAIQEKEKISVVNLILYCIPLV